MKPQPNTLHLVPPVDSAAPAAPSAPSAPRDVEPRFRCLFDANPAPVLWLDPQGRIIDANPAVQAQFGHEPHLLRGQPLSLLMPDWDRPDMLCDLAQGQQRHEATLRHAQGHRCDVVVSLLATSAGGTAPACGYFLVARDVSTQRRRQRQMQVQAEILARTHDAVAVLDESEKVVCWNAGAARLYGASARDMIGQAFGSLFESPDRARLEQALAEVRYAAAEPSRLQLRRTGPQGTEAHLMLFLSRVAGVEWGSELWLVQGQDISARLQFESALKLLRSGAGGLDEHGLAEILQLAQRAVGSLGAALACEDARPAAEVTP